MAAVAATVLISKPSYIGSLSAVAVLVSLSAVMATSLLSFSIFSSRLLMSIV